jgi:hypothetical protein
MDAMGAADAASVDDRGDRLPGCGCSVGGHLGSQDVGFNQEGRTTMKRFVLCIAAVLMIGLGMSGQETRADDDLQFATPAMTEAGTAAACEAGACQTTRIARTGVAYHRSRRPIARWFQEHRPVRRVLRGAVRLFGRRCCH